MTRLTRALGAAILALILGLSLTPGLPQAEAKPPTPGRAWPGKKIHKITYVDQTKDSDAVKYAVKAWNKSGVDIRFKKVTSARKAQLIIRNSKRVPSGCGSGLAQLGFVPGRKAFVNILHGTDADGQGCAVSGQSIVVAHELGHVLGLGHTDKKCSLMNTSVINGVAPSACIGDDLELAKPGRWYCGLFAPGDLKAAAKIYGGKPKTPTAEYCDASPRIPTTGAVTPAFDAAGNLSLTLTRAPEPALPGWLGPYGYGAPGYEIHATTGACTAVAGDDATQRTWSTWTVPVGGAETRSLGSLTRGEAPLPPGPACVRVWQFDLGSNYAAVPTDVAIVVPAASARSADGARQVAPRDVPAPGPNRTVVLH